jgi:hypothetical protein
MTLLEQLQQLKSLGEQNSNTGICNQLCISPLDRGTLEHLMWMWPKCSGDRMCPVPSTIKYMTAAECYSRHRRSRKLWDKRTAYGRLRYELLDFLIAELSNDVA